MARAMAGGHSLDLRPMSVGSPLMTVFVVILQSQAIRLAVSRAMGPAPFTLGRLGGVCLSSGAFFECAPDNSVASTDTIT